MSGVPVRVSHSYVSDPGPKVVRNFQSFRHPSRYCSIPSPHVCTQAPPRAPEHLQMLNNLSATDHSDHANDSHLNNPSTAAWVGRQCDQHQPIRSNARSHSRTRLPRCFRPEGIALRLQLKRVCCSSCRRQHQRWDLVSTGANNKS